MAKRPITDALLNLAIETKLDAGVAAERIRVLIEVYAEYEMAEYEMDGDRPREIVDFLWIEDIAPSRRAEFLTALLALSPEPKHAIETLRHPDARPTVLAIPLLTRARAVLRLAFA